MIKHVLNAFFYLIVFLIPLNLGKHFITVFSYVRGLLVDYLVPTLYVTDILIFIFLVLWAGYLIKTRFNFWTLLNSPSFAFIVLFAAAVFLSIFFAVRPLPAVYIFARLVLYLGFMVYVLLNFNAPRDFEKLVYVVSASVLFVSILGIFQWVSQKSVFDNYLFFGEQPYNWSTFGIAKDAFFGVTKIPSYGTFRHPNVFGGYLSIVLVWILTYIFLNKGRLALAVVFTMGAVSLFFTLSYVSWIAFLLGLLFLFLILRFKNAGRVLSVIITAVLVVGALALPLLVSSSGVLSENPSFYRRAALLESAYQIIPGNILFGVGLNNSILSMASAVSISSKPFIQPVHNIFVLLLLEGGIFSLVFFGAVLVTALFSVYRRSVLFFVSLLQFLILGSYDHYVLTMHQILLLFLLTVGISLAYNFKRTE